MVLQLLPTFLTYVALTACPGPGNMAVGAVAARHGRRSGLIFAAGLLLGGLTWAVLAATGVSSLLAAAEEWMVALKAVCAAFLFLLAWRSARTALRGKPPAEAQGPSGTPTWPVLARRGFLLQVSNPKSVITWIAVMSVGLRAGSSPLVPFVIIAICEVLGVTVFAGYAFVFSIGAVARSYRRAYRWVEGALGAFFATVGVRVLTSQRL